MTISSSVRLAGPYTGTGSVYTYPFAFKVFQASDVLVKQTDLSGNIATLALTTNYSVSLSSDQNANPGGSVNLNLPLPNGYQLVISSQVQELQGTSLTNNGGFYPSVIEDALDYLTILVQQLQTNVSNSLQLPITVTGISTQLPAPSGGQLLGWNTAGTALINLTPSGVGAGSIFDVNVAANAAVASSKIAFASPLTGGVTRPLNAKLADTSSVMDVGGAFYPAGSTAAFQQAATNGGTYTAPDGKYAIGTVNAGANLSYWSFFNVTDNSGNPLSLPGTQELWYGGSKFFYQPIGIANAANGVLRAERVTNYTGGTSGFECPTVKVNTSVGAGNTNYETGLLVVLDNYATGTSAENVGAHFQSNKRSTSPTWCFANEANDLTGSANPTTGLVGIEQVVAANGTDASNNRVGFDIIASRPNSSGVYSGTQAQVGIGLRLTNQVADTGANNSFGVGILFRGYYDNSVMDTSAANVTGNVVLNMSTAQRIRLSNSGNKDIAHDGTGMVYQTGLSTVIRLNDDGSILFGGASPATRLMGTTGSGTSAPVLTANKPGTGTAITTWLSVMVNGVQLWVPAWSN